MTPKISQIFFEVIHMTHCYFSSKWVKIKVRQKWLARPKGVCFLFLTIFIMRKFFLFSFLVIGLAFYANSVLGYGGGGGGGSVFRASGPAVLTPKSVQSSVPASVSAPALGQVLGIETFRFTDKIGWGSRGDEVIELQKVLKEKGLYSGRADGIFGPMTSAALKIFQTQNNLTPVGFVGPGTQVALNNYLIVKSKVSTAVSPIAAVAPEKAFKFENDIKFGTRGGDVAELQKALNKLGFSAGKIDGIFWQKTLAAVKEFQVKNGLAAVGLVGPKTRELLNKLNQ